MIVISSSIVLTANPGGEAPNGNNPVIGWRNLVVISNVQATDSDPAYPVANAANPSTALRWQALNTTGDKFITVTTNQVDPIDYVGIAGHNFGSAQIAVSVEGDNGSGFTQLIAPILLPNDQPVLFRFVPTSLQALRIKMVPGAAPARAAVVYVGKLLVLPRRIYVGHRVLPFNRRANIVTGMSEVGHFLGRLVLSETTESALDLQNILPSFYRAEMDPWLKAAIERPFFFAWRPFTYPLEVGYCWGTSDAQMSNQRPNGTVQVSLGLQGIVA